MKAWLVLKSRDRLLELVGLLLLLTYFLSINIVWLWRFRLGQPVVLDEAGYLAFSVADYRALTSGGLISWIHTVETQSMYAPLMPAISSLVYCVFGPGEFLGFLTVVFAGLAASIATYFLGKRLGGIQLGFVSATLVATCPLVLNYSREYSFAMPVTAVMTIALVALLWSDGFARAGRGAIFGIFLGLIPLARTMAIAFLPGLVGAAAIEVAKRGPGHQRCAALVGALLIGFGVSAAWLWWNWRDVWAYLTGAGYGADSLLYGHKQSLLHIGTWSETIRLLAGEIYLPHFAFLFAGAFALAVLFARLVHREGLATAVKRALMTGIAPLAIVIIEGVAALSSTGNKGTGFIAPLLPAMFVVAAWAFLRLLNGSATFSCGVIAMALLFSAPMFDITSPIARPWNANVPLYGPITVTSGFGVIQEWVGATGPAWVDANARTVAELMHRGAANTRTAFGFRGSYLNPNTMGLELLLGGREPFATDTIPMTLEDSARAYESWLTEGTDCLLLTINRNRDVNEYGPLVTPSFVELAARESGFTPTSTWSLPGGTTETLWRSRYCAGLGTVSRAL